MWRQQACHPASRRFFEAMAWQACYSCHEEASAYAFRLRQAARFGFATAVNDQEDSQLSRQQPLT